MPPLLLFFLIQVICSGDWKIRLWNLNTGKMVKIISGENEIVRALVILPDGRRLAGACGNSMIKIWNIDNSLK